MTPRTTPPLARLEDLMAWATGYDLIAALVLDGPRGERRQDLMRIPELVPLLEGVSEDELLADHYDLFGRAVPPFANAFLAEEALAGGDQAARLARLYREAGYAPPADAPGEDHLGVIVQALAHAVLTEVEMARHGDHDGVRRARRLQTTLLDAHLLSWAWPLAYAIAGEPHPLYARLVSAMLEVLAAHRASLDDEWRVAGAPDVATPDTSDTKALGAWLAAPRRAGVFLTRREVQEMARAEELPKAFGESRAALVGETLAAAARFGRSRALLTRLAAAVDGAAQFYDAVPPPLRPATSPWSARARRTTTLLSALAAEADAP